MYQSIIKKILFLFDPEKIHHFSFAMFRWSSKIPGVSFLIRKMYCVEHPTLERSVFGLTFKNPVGLAAGFDKDAKLYNELSNFGFGFIEIGTLTPKGQEGNPKKRLFRLKEDHAIINRMGFNNEGVDAAVKRLKKNSNVLIGGNIGKNKITPNENAVDDYIYCFEAIFNYGDLVNDPQGFILSSRGNLIGGIIIAIFSYFTKQRENKKTRYRSCRA